MSYLPDPAEIDAIAERIADQARSTRARALALGSLVAGTGWHGLAADAFYRTAHGVVAGLRGAADRLDDAADALHRHARAVQRVLDSLAHLRHDLLGFGVDVDMTVLDTVLHADRLLGAAGNLVGAAGNLVGDTGHLVGDAGGMVGGVVGGVGDLLGVH